MAHDAMKIENENAINGIQLSDSTSNSHDFSIVYTPKVIKPNAVPIVDTPYKN